MKGFKFVLFIRPHAGRMHRTARKGAVADGQNDSRAAANGGTERGAADVRRGGHGAMTKSSARRTAARRRDRRGSSRLAGGLRLAAGRAWPTTPYERNGRAGADVSGLPPRARGPRGAGVASDRHGLRLPAPTTPVRSVPSVRFEAIPVDDAKAIKHSASRGGDAEQQRRQQQQQR
ncbi:unnamed protein product [Lampetra fluviatilis]